MNMKFNGYFHESGNKVFCGYNDFDQKGIQYRDKNLIEYLRNNKEVTAKEFLNIIKNDIFYSKGFIDDFEKKKNLIDQRCQKNNVMCIFQIIYLKIIKIN